MVSTALLDGMTAAMEPVETSPSTALASVARGGAASLRAYVPAVVAQWPVDGPRWREVEGTLLFLDVSGFTALSELMARRGRQGAELVTDALNLVFGALLDVAANAGGDLLKFGGDALLVLFQGEGHASRAAQAAVAMRGALRSVGSKRSTGGVTLRASFGLATGQLYLVLAGDQYDELVVAGPAVDAALDAEAAAASGQVLAAAGTASLLPRAWRGPVEGEFVEVRGAPRLNVHAPVRAEPRRDLWRALPPAVASSVASGRLPGEHRLAAVGFVKFKGIAALLEEAGAEGVATTLGDLLAEAQRAASRHGLCLIATDVDHDGGKLIFTAGVPGALDDPGSLAILAVLEVLEHRLPLGLSAGVHSGRLFAGDVGSSSRRTFTVIGDTVNTAARVMARAGTDEALVSIEALATVRTLFETSEPISFAAKGKTAPLVARAVRRPLGRRDDSQGAVPFAGRKTELAALRAALDTTSGGPSFIDITGDGGIGKSRLVEEFLVHLPGVPVLRAQTASYARDIPYRALVPALRNALSIPVDSDSEEAGALLRRAVLARAPELRANLHLLAAPFEATARESGAARIDPRFRMERQHAAVRALLSACLDERAIIVVEDRQWLDDASRALLQALAFDDGPALVIANSRTVEGQPENEAGVLHLPLGPLDPASLREIANAFADVTPLPPYAVDDAIVRCGGNPLFLLELLREAPVEGGSLPDSVEQLMANRLDRLDATARRNLQELSVAGATFDIGTAAAALGTEPAEAHHVLELLAAFVERDEGGVYRFRDRLYQECAYRMMSFRVRREVHARIAHFLESASDISTGGLLSYHWWEAGDDARAFELLEKAAADARARYANLDAAANYRRALAAAARLRGVSASHRRQLFESLGDALEMTGQFAAAEDAFEAAMRLSHSDPHLLLKRATIRERRGQYSGAVRLIRRGLRLASAQEPRDPAIEAELLTLLSGVRFRQGRLYDAAAAARLAITEAEAAGGGARLAHSLYLLGHAESLRGNKEGHAYLLRSLPLVEEAGALVLKANVLNNLGVQAYFEGNLERAIEYYEESRRARDECGDVVGAATQQNNIAEALSDLGRLEEAEQLLRQARATWRSSGYQVGVALATLNLGRLATRRRHYGEAHALLTEAAQQFRAIGADDLLLQARTLLAENWLNAGEPEEAALECQGCLSEADRSDKTAALAALLVVHGQALAALHREPEARAGLEEAAAVAHAAGAANQAAAAETALAALSVR